jgi:hypothetical protein
MVGMLVFTLYSTLYSLKLNKLNVELCPTPLLNVGLYPTPRLAGRDVRAAAQLRQHRIDNVCPSASRCRGREDNAYAANASSGRNLSLQALKPCGLAPESLSTLSS